MEPTPKAKLTRKLAGDCDDATCPAVWETDDPAMVGVQGQYLAEPGVGLGDGEAVVLLPKALLSGL
jgi:hypothetical protein